MAKLAPHRPEQSLVLQGAGCLLGGSQPSHQLCDPHSRVGGSQKTISSWKRCLRVLDKPSSPPSSSSPVSPSQPESLGLRGSPHPQRLAPRSSGPTLFLRPFGPIKRVSLCTCLPSDHRAGAQPRGLHPQTGLWSQSTGLTAALTAAGPRALPVRPVPARSRGQRPLRRGWLSHSGWQLISTGSFSPSSYYFIFYCCESVLYHTLIIQDLSLGLSVHREQSDWGTQALFSRLEPEREQ